MCSFFFDFLQNLSTMNILDPIFFLSHVISTTSAKEPLDTVLHQL